MGHLSTHQRLEIVGMFYDLKGLNIGNKFKRVVEMAKVKGIVTSEVSVRSITPEVKNTLIRRFTAGKNV